jgi:hypothetical protein
LDFYEKTVFAFRFNTPTTFPESGSRKRFHALEIRAIDSPHKITPKNDFVGVKTYNP